MRPLAGLAIAFGVSGTLFAAAGAAAQTAPAALESAGSQLVGAAFARTSAPARPAADPISSLLDRKVQPDIDWTASREVSLASAHGGAVDTLRLSTGEELRTNAAGLPLVPGRTDPIYELRLTRDWPGAMSFESDRYGLDFTPHAGFGVSSAGGSAEAGAAITLSRKSADERVAAGLSALGLRDGARLGAGGRWYVFAAASGRAMGLNMQKDGRSWDRAWSQDAASTLVGDAQVGVGWKKGPMQTSFGYIHREVKGDHMLWGQETKDDSMVAFSLAIKPRR
jgi:hypothetical protein